MRISRIYINQPLNSNQSINVDAATAHYMGTVLRMKSGRQVVVFDGRGGEYAATIGEVKKKTITLDVGDFVETQTESPLAIELACCLIKNDRMDWLLQKATELGVTRFSPLLSEYSDVKIPAERLQKKINHWQQVVISACEQSGRTLIPEVRPPQALQPWVDSCEAEQKLVLHPYRSRPLSQLSAGKSPNLALLIGPEGGLSDAEVALAHTKEFASISLGPRILRAETAPLAALSIIQHQLGDMP